MFTQLILAFTANFVMPILLHLRLFLQQLTAGAPYMCQIHNRIIDCTIHQWTRTEGFGLLLLLLHLLLSDS